MDALPQLIMLLSQHSGPMLTWYGHERTELTGPVLARWITKSTNLLGNDYAADLFGDEAPSPSILRLSLGNSWQTLLWQISAELMGWQVLIDEAPSPIAQTIPDVHISSAPAPLEESSAAWKLLQNPSPLAFSWGEPLPAGTLDALAELMAQSDMCETVPTEDAPTWEEWLSSAPTSRKETNASRLCLVTPPSLGASEASLLWSEGHSLVVLDAKYYPTTDEHQRIASRERAELIA